MNTTAALLTGLSVVVLGACQTTGNAPAPNTGDGGSSTPDANVTKGDGGEKGKGADGGREADGSSQRPDASRAPVDGSPDTLTGETGADGSSPKDAAGPDAMDAAAKHPFKGVAGGSCPELVQLGVGWWYDWETTPTGCTGTPFIPMVWGHGGSEQSSAGIASEVGGFVSAGYQYVLGFNEPDNTTQSNISVATAISLWPAFDNPALLIGSPATQGTAGGLTWIQDFMTQVNADTSGKLRVDFIATHWYGWDTGACDPAANGLESWIAGIEAIPGNRPIWLTEWGCDNQSNPNAATVEAFYAGALAMFANHPRVARYAWYQWAPYNELINADGGALTTLGAAYAAAPAFH